MALASLASLCRDAASCTTYQAITVVTILVTAFFVQTWLRSTAGSISKFPLVGESLGSFSKRKEDFLKHGVELFTRASKQFKHTPWRVTTNDGETVIIPLQYLDELRGQPEDIASSSAANTKTFETRHVGITPDNPLMAHIVKADLTHNLARISTAISPAVQQAVAEEIGACEDWTEVYVYQKVLNIVAVVSGHVFVGPELARRKEYLHASINFTVDLFKAIGALKRWPKWMRPVVKNWIPEVRAVEEHRRRVHEFLIPVIRERRAQVAREDKVPDDFITWMVKKAGRFNIESDEVLAETQLILGMAATHTTTMTVVQILYDLIGYSPEVIPELRRDFQGAVTAGGGVMTTQALYNMKLLDSVMRESQRVNPFNVMRMQRVTLKPMRFSDGVEVPAGVDLAVPSILPMRDPEVYSDPDRFDPYRFAHLRSGEAEDPLGYGNKDVYQFISVARENMGFGYGKHACPGRFFAANEIKMICGYMLINYEVKLPDGVEGRYKNVMRGGSTTPDPTKSIMFKAVK